MRKHYWFIVFVALLLTSLACQSLASGLGTPTRPPSVATEQVKTVSPTLSENSSGTNNNSNVGSELFPMPGDAENVIKMGDETVIFQTKMSLEDAMLYYREAYEKQGYTERTQLTVTSDQTFSMVFDGHPSGKGIVVQGVDIGNGSINITITLQGI